MIELRKATEEILNKNKRYIEQRFLPYYKGILFNNDLILKLGAIQYEGFSSCIYQCYPGHIQVAGVQYTLWWPRGRNNAI